MHQVIILLAIFLIVLFIAYISSTDNGETKDDKETKEPFTYKRTDYPNSDQVYPEKMTDYGPRHDLDWSEELVENIEPKIKQEQKNFVNNVRRFGGSATRNFVIEDMSTNPAYTNFYGFKRPAFIPVRKSNREQPSFSTEVFKNFRRHLF